MIGSILATIAALAGQNADSVKAKVDRSGEAMLRSFLAEISEEKAYHGLILRSHRETSESGFTPNASMEIWRDAKKLRVEFGDLEGASILVVSDGNKVLEDVGDESLTLRNASDLPAEQSDSIGPDGTAASPWFFLMEGPSLLDRLSGSCAISLGASPNSIIWDSNEFGSVTVTKNESVEELSVWELEFDHLPYQTRLSSLDSVWVKPIDPTSRWRQKVILTSTNHFPKKVFSTKGVKGRPLHDLTSE